MVSKYRFLVLLAVALVAIGVIGASTTFAATSKPLPQAESETGASDGGGTDEEMTVEYDDGSGYIPPSGEQSPPPTGGGDDGTVAVDNPTGNEEYNPFEDGCEQEQADKMTALAQYNIEVATYNSLATQYEALSEQIESLEDALAHPAKKYSYTKRYEGETVSRIRLYMLQESLDKLSQSLEDQYEVVDAAYKEHGLASRTLIACKNA